MKLKANGRYSAQFTNLEYVKSEQLHWYFLWGFTFIWKLEVIKVDAAEEWESN